jgi:GRASP55/65 PDZ-like domain
LSSLCKGQQVRDLHLPVSSQDPRLGLTLQWTPLAATENVWHILEVIPDSPADQAGLLPYGDYIIGTPEGIVHGESGLGELVEDFLSRPLRLWVYNNEYAVTRPVTITPSRAWGGEGALGCVLGYGALHRLPPALSEPPSAPGDTLFETARFSNEESRATSNPASSIQNYGQPPANTLEPSSLLTPADIAAPPPVGQSQANASTGRGGRKPRKGVSPNRGFDDMWKEGEDKSKEEDFAPPKKPDETPLPPPPKRESPTKEGPSAASLSFPSAERTETASPAPIIDEDDTD